MPCWFSRRPFGGNDFRYSIHWLPDGRLLCCRCDDRRMGRPRAAGRLPLPVTLVLCSVLCVAGVMLVLCDNAGLSTWVSAAIALAAGSTVRVLALYYAWREPLARGPKGVYVHDDGRPLLGRKLKGKSVREMEALGLSVSDSAGNAEEK